MESFYKMIYFLVSSSKAYTEDGLGFHREFFINNNGFLFSLLLAIIIAVLVAVIFYFGLCMKKDTFSAAKTSNWVVALVIAAICCFFVNDILLVGSPKYSGKGISTYYKSNDDFVIKMQESTVSPEEYTAERDNLNENISNWKDVRVQYNLNSVFWCVIVFCGVSIAIKGLTPYGNCIPCKWPTK